MSEIPQDIIQASNAAAGHVYDPHESRGSYEYVRDIIAKAILAERERCAEIAYRVCSETRHVTLGDKASAAIIGTS